MRSLLNNTNIVITKMGSKSGKTIHLFSNKYYVKYNILLNFKKVDSIACKS